MMLIEGGNYRIERVTDIVRCRVWRRQDINGAAGAALAEEKARHLSRLASETGVRGLIMDLGKAPPLVGPRTQAALAQILAAWEQRQRLVVFVVGSDAMQNVQLWRLKSDHAPTHGHLVATPAEADALF